VADTIGQIFMELEFIGQILEKVAKYQI